MILKETVKSSTEKGLVNKKRRHKRMSYVEGQLQGGHVWRITSGFGMMEVSEFIRKYLHEDYSLSFFDCNGHEDARTAEIECDYRVMERIIEYVVNAEHTMIHFIGENTVTKSYVIGIDFTRGYIEYGNYKAENGGITLVSK